MFRLKFVLAFGARVMHGIIGSRQFFCAAVEDGATASSCSSTSQNEASRANRPGTRLPEDPEKINPQASC
ncbi:MAG: hypothetical protein ACLP2X_15720 [Syntrophobacteraceae bacterium]